MPFELFVLADDPSEGLANERLLSLLSPAEAVLVYKAFIEDTLMAYLTASTLLSASTNSSQKRSVRVHLACYPDCKNEFFHDLARKTGVSLQDQGHGDKGERILRLWNRSLDHGALAVLSAEVNSPGLSQETLPRALDLIERTGTVLGPNDRGGLYLLGCLKMDGEILHDIPWSTTREAETICYRLRRAKQRFEQLPEFWSICEPDDLVRLKRLLSVEPGRAPATARAIRALEH